jgi:hypothetical protein
VYNNKIWVTGLASGLSGNQYTSQQTVSYDPDTDTWADEVAPIPFAAGNHMCFNWRDGIYAYNGTDIARLQL